MNKDDPHFGNSCKSKQITGESLAYLAEILRDENTEFGPQDRAAMLLLVNMFQYGLSESKEEEEPPCEAGPVTEMYQATGSCAHCACYSDGHECCDCGETDDNAG